MARHQDRGRPISDKRSAELVTTLREIFAGTDVLFVNDQLQYKQACPPREKLVVAASSAGGSRRVPS